MALFPDLGYLQYYLFADFQPIPDFKAGQDNPLGRDILRERTGLQYTFVFFHLYEFDLFHHGFHGKKAYLF